MMKSDISTRDDIFKFVKTFYTKAMSDDLIGEYFTEVVALDLEVHIPKISAFWSSVLFGTGNYRGNPVIKHIELHKKRNLGKIQFDRWLELWHSTIDELFKGERAEEVKSKAATMAELMLIKIKASEGKGYIY